MLFDAIDRVSRIAGEVGGVGLVVNAKPPAVDFYKSMTTHADHRIWQDVYHAKTANSADVYLKLSVIDDVLIVSFKEL